MNLVANMENQDEYACHSAHDSNTIRRARRVVKIHAPTAAACIAIAALAGAVSARTLVHVSPVGDGAQVPDDQRTLTLNAFDDWAYGGRIVYTATTVDSQTWTVAAFSLKGAKLGAQTVQNYSHMFATNTIVYVFTSLQTGTTTLYGMIAFDPMLKTPLWREDPGEGAVSYRGYGVLTREAPGTLVKQGSPARLPFVSRMWRSNLF